MGDYNGIERRIVDKLKRWAAILLAVAAIVTTCGTVYSWYFKGGEVCKKVAGLEVKVVDHEKRIIETEKYMAAQNEINKNVDSANRKLDILLLRTK